MAKETQPKKRRTRVGTIVKRTFDWNWAYKNVHREFKMLYMFDTDDDHKYWGYGEFDITDDFYARGSKKLTFSGGSIHNPLKFVRYANSYGGERFYRFDQYSDKWK